MFGHLAPPGTALCEAYGADRPEALFAEEAALVGDAAGNRRREFALGRTCARRALRRVGFPPVAIPRGPRRSPVWPDGAVGSITHCAGYAAAVAAPATGYAAIGIDAEPHAPLPAGLLDKVALPAERDALRGLDASVAWDRLLFCLKESVYKAWYPLAACWLGFDQARVDLDPAAGTFRVRLLVTRPHTAVEAVQAGRGVFGTTDGLLFAMLAVPRPA